ncbi:MAG TPA: amidohydrolase family protein, partial [Acidimicrobiales bacterium]|nr:amidohydrolase family protein [Acidimicrobiales bacterium]
MPEPRLISVDDHVIEPPGVWRDRLPARDRDRGPHVVRQDGIDVWVYEDVRMPITSLLVQAGKTREEVRPGFINYEDMRPGVYDSVHRAKDMDTDGVLASACFPFFPRYCGQTFYEAEDRDLAWRCVRAYNDWMIEEWSGSSPGRFIPMIILPLWDPALAAAEIERAASLGAKAITFSENPAKLGLPSLHDAHGYWDPVLSAANDAAMPLCLHFGSSSMVPNTSDDAPIFVSAALSPLNLAYALADWLFCGKFERYPQLKICLSEGGIGWIPYLLDRADQVLDTMMWARRFDVVSGMSGGSSSLTGDRAGRRLAEMVGEGQAGGTMDLGTWEERAEPRQLFHEHVFGCFIDDRFGARHLDEIGWDNVMMETDYPHGDGTFPHSLARAKELLAPYSSEQQYQVMQGNARRVFRL